MGHAVPAVSSLSRAAIEAMAADIVSRVSPQTLSASAPFPIHPVCEFKLEELCGVTFAVDDLPAGTEGRFEGNELIVDSKVYEAVLAGDGRARFTLAHEFAHCRLHKRAIQNLNSQKRGTVQLYRRGALPAYMDPEWQANTFAASLLMPVSAVKFIVHDLPQQWKLLAPAEVARRLQVSQQAAKYRVSDLAKRGVITV